jgi:hypothetical protein
MVAAHGILVSSHRSTVNRASFYNLGLCQNKREAPKKKMETRGSREPELGGHGEHGATALSSCNTPGVMSSISREVKAREKLPMSSSIFRILNSREMIIKLYVSSLWRRGIKWIL